ncbi:MAG: ABC transporter permease [Chloroflexi bacterium]|nr:ABC transporter permease [Chloroflexota bacterium]
MTQPLRRFFTRFQNWVGVLVVFDFVVVAILGGLLEREQNSVPAPGGLLPLAQQVVKNKMDLIPQPPSPEHPLGTLTQQRDILVWLVEGARQALEFSLKASLISAVIGVLVGASSAYAGGILNGLVLRFSDALLAVPLIAVVVMIRQVQAVLFTRMTLNQILSIDVFLWAIVLVNWIPYARLINATVTILKEAQFVHAARAVGAGPGRIILRHLLPNAISPALVLLARDLGWLVILQASLQFAGLGVGSVWGDELLQGRNWIIGLGGNPFGYWWVWLPGTLVLVLYGVGWNLIGDGLDEALNPRIAKLWK